MVRLKTIIYDSFNSLCNPWYRDIGLEEWFIADLFSCGLPLEPERMLDCLNPKAFQMCIGWLCYKKALTIS